MAKLRVHAFGISVDGYGAGPQHLFGEIDLLKLGYACTEHVSTAKANHILIAKR